jgi:hypothetical protein
VSTEAGQAQLPEVRERAGKIFCLAEGPDPAAVSRVHKEAHGLVAQELYRVSEHT